MNSSTGINGKGTERFVSYGIGDKLLLKKRDIPVGTMVSFDMPDNSKVNAINTGLDFSTWREKVKGDLFNRYASTFANLIPSF
jgi:hypothetical protein